MKWITRIFSVLGIVASFIGAMYIGYRWLRGFQEDSDYLFGDGMYDPQDQSGLYAADPAEEEKPMATDADALFEEGPVLKHSAPR